MTVPRWVTAGPRLALVSALAGAGIFGVGWLLVEALQEAACVEPCLEEAYWAAWREQLPTLLVLGIMTTPFFVGLLLGVAGTLSRHPWGCQGEPGRRPTCLLRRVAVAAALLLALVHSGTYVWDRETGDQTSLLLAPLVLWLLAAVILIRAASLMKARAPEVPPSGAAEEPTFTRRG